MGLDSSRPAAHYWFMPMSLEDVNGMDEAAFVAALGPAFENSPGFARAVWNARPFASVAALKAAIARSVDDAHETEKLVLLRAHPDLAGKAARAGTLGAHSTREQAGAGLDRLNDAEYERFHRLNEAYAGKFGFPFIIAVRDHDKEGILAAFERRLENAMAEEMATALAQVKRIVELRLDDMIAAGAPLSDA
ncbi:MAG: 2-oxo-4-hydroxy-4-carboxy-5-ureidoimidazoline decarboxylase [Alphaproteobacteria bacterium]